MMDDALNDAKAHRKREHLLVGLTIENASA